jgi:dienelactone hydrolase
MAMRLIAAPSTVTLRLAAGLAAATLAGVLAACGGQAGQSGQVAIAVSAPTALADQAISISVTGLATGQRITIAAQAVDDAHRVWRAQATYTAGQHGEVNLTSALPAAGTYPSADGMGLFWSMTTLPGESGNEYFTPAQPQSQPSFPVRLTVTSDGKLLASRTVTRYWMASGETARVLTLKADRVAGVLFLPRPGTARHPGVLVFGGAEGGMSQTFTAALLAAHGYPALTVAYFDWPGLPDQLQRIPLEYFVTAGRILASQPGVDPSHLLVMGYSRGSEAALLLADHFPGLFHGAIVYSPSSDVNPAENTALAYISGVPAWTLGGKGVWPAPIPVNDVSGPVLAIAGDSDALWNSGPSADQISSELDVDRSPYRHQALVYLNAGHGVGTFPYQPIGTAALQALGGTRAADVAAQRASWTAVLGQLAQLSG